jgi:hypothetical protein
MHTCVHVHTRAAEREIKERTSCLNKSKTTYRILVEKNDLKSLPMNGSHTQTRTLRHTHFFNLLPMVSLHSTVHRGRKFELIHTQLIIWALNSKRYSLLKNKNPSSIDRITDFYNTEHVHEWTGTFLHSPSSFPIRMWLLVYRKNKTNAWCDVLYVITTEQNMCSQVYERHSSKPRSKKSPPERHFILSESLVTQYKYFHSYHSIGKVVGTPCNNLD